MSLLEPLTSAIAAIELASDEIAREIHRTIKSSDLDGLEQKTQMARRLLAIRKSAESLIYDITSADLLHRTKSEGIGQDHVAPLIEAVRTEISADSPLAPNEVEVSFTPAEAYGNYILLGLVLLKGACRYRDAQKVMQNCMVAEGILKPADLECTPGTTRPRILAQSSSHRITLLRRKLLTKGDAEVDMISQRGRDHLNSWVGTTGRSLSDFGFNVDSDLVDLYFHAGNYLMTLSLLGGDALDRDVCRISVHLTKTFPVLVRNLSLVGSRELSPNHLETFEREKLIRVRFNGAVFLTGAGETVAMAQLSGCGIPEQAFRKHLPRKR